MLFQSSGLMRAEYATPLTLHSTIRDETGYRPSLWVVNDAYAEHPTGRFTQTQQELFEAVVESYGQGVFESFSDKAFYGILKYAKDFLSFLRIPEVPEFPVEDQLRCFLSHIDYGDLYFLFTDTPVQLVPSKMDCTYTETATGATLDPERVEIFKVMYGWDFWPYRVFNEMMASPKVQDFGRGLSPRHSQTGAILTTKDILAGLCEPVIGSYDWYEPFMAEAVNRALEDGYFNSATLEEHSNYSGMFDFMLESLMAVAVAAAAYLKSPMGLKLLTYYHPVYYEVLDWDYDTDQPKVREGTGGECILYGAIPHTLKSLTKHEAVPAGTCRKCSQTLHCTKLLDANALIWKVCSCGSLLDPVDHDRSKSHSGANCKDAKVKHPPIPSFVCFRCTELHLKYENISEAPPQLKCSRTACPNTTCAHHMGEAYRRHELNQRRKLMLTQGSVS